MKVSYDILCLDETGTSSMNEFYDKTKIDIKNMNSKKTNFGITGVIIPGAEYPDLNIKGRKIQERCFGQGCYTPFHYVDILNKANKYSALGVNPSKYISLITLLNNLVKDTKYKVISCIIDKKQLALSFGRFYLGKLNLIKKIKPNLWIQDTPKNINLYEISLKFILSEFHRYLSKRKKRGIIIAEARGEKEDRLLLNAFYKYQKSGAGSLSGKTIRDYITDLLIIRKSQNHLGTQLADLVNYPTLDFFINNHQPRTDHFIKKDSFEKKIISLILFPFINSEKNIIAHNIKSQS